jgi:hypothetical protein
MNGNGLKAFLVVNGLEQSVGFAQPPRVDWQSVRFFSKSNEPSFKVSLRKVVNSGRRFGVNELFIHSFGPYQKNVNHFINLYLFISSH